MSAAAPGLAFDRAVPQSRVPAWVVKLQCKPQPSAFSTPARGASKHTVRHRERTPGAQRQRHPGCSACGRPAETMTARAELLGKKSSPVLAASAEMATPSRRARDADSGPSHDAAVPVCVGNPPPCGLITPPVTAQLCALRGAEVACPGTAGAKAGPRAQSHASLEQGNCPSSPPTQAGQGPVPLSTEAGAGLSLPALVPSSPFRDIHPLSSHVASHLGLVKVMAKPVPAARARGPRWPTGRSRGRVAPGALHLPGPGAPGGVQPSSWDGRTA